MDQQEAYRDWIARGLEKPGKRKRDLADALRLNPSAVTRILDGSRRLQLTEIPRIAAYLGEAPPEIASDMPLDDAEDAAGASVPLKGYVAAGSQARFLPLDDGEFDRVSAPPEWNDKTFALEIRGTSLGELFDRWLVYADDVRSPVTPDLIGKPCIVGLADGRILVKKLKRARGGLYDLLSNTEEPILGVTVDWAAKVKHMGPR